MAKPRLEEFYTTVLRPQLQEKLALGNIMEVPKLDKIVLNVGVKGAVADSRELQHVAQWLTAIAGQAPVKTAARKSIAAFKIRQGMQLGVRVTLRREKMYSFLDKLLNLALPKVRDFHGVAPTSFDGRGNYNLGIKDLAIFPEIETLPSDKTYGMNITIGTTAANNAHGYELLKGFGMPFRKQ
jgi:large subunit ribosomal protein L5